MDFSALFAPITTWLDAHPAAVAWALGWIAALSAAQMVKQFLPVAWTTAGVKRVTQLVAIAAGFGVAYAVWPNTGHRMVYAGIVGSSAPSAYTFLKAIIEARWPRLAAALSWDGIRERRDEPPTCGPAP